MGEKNNAHPIMVPKPILSFSDGKNLFMISICSNLLNQGITVTNMMTGRLSLVVSRYLCISESVARNPKGSPNERLDIVSRVKYEAVRPKSRGLVSDFDEIYFRSMRSISARTFWSIVSSNPSTSLPEY